MRLKAKMLRLTGQSHRYLKECVRLDSLITRRLGTLMECANLAILLYFWQRVEQMEASGFARLVNAELVQDARRELESLPLEQRKAGKEEKARAEPQAGNFDIA